VSVKIETGALDTLRFFGYIQVIEGAAMTKILIVDDEINVRKLYSEELRSDGYETVSAATVAEAMESVEKEDPDLVILDIKLGEESGIDALMKIAKQRKRLPVILNSAYSVYKDNFQTWAADAYIVKSVDLAPLKEKIRDLLTTRRSPA
jgi:DNA-binding NtrC family response regulator